MGGKEAEDLFDERLEFGGEELVRLHPQNASHGEQMSSLHRDAQGFTQDVDGLSHAALPTNTNSFSHLIHDEHGAVVKLRDALVGEIENATRRGHHNVDRVVQAHDVVLQTGASCGDHHLDAHVLS